MQVKSHDIDMCNGPLLGKIIRFSIPLVLTGVLQLIFNTADMIVVGRFVGPQALAAVGATSALVNLIINLFTGLSVGVNVVVARFLGHGNKRETGEAANTALLLGIISGVMLVFIGYFLSNPLLKLMGTPDDVIEQSTLYMRIYFAGMPILMTYNFGASILRAAGDTKHSLYYLLAAGVLNVILNIIFVTLFNMGVGGVALATVLSQVLAVSLLLKTLMKTDQPYKIELKKLKFSKEKLIMMIKIGIPSGVQGIAFSLSNVLIQSSVNQFGSVAMAGNTAGASITGFAYIAMNAFSQASLSFVSQNFGANKPERIKRSTILSVLCVSITGITIAWTAYIFKEQLLGFYSSDAEVIKYGVTRLSIELPAYFLCGVMEVLCGSLRGLGSALMPMLFSIGGSCAFRILWIFTVFRMKHTLPSLYISYPISWFLTAMCHLICLIIMYKKMYKRNFKQS